MFHLLSKELLWSYRTHTAEEQSNLSFPAQSFPRSWGVRRNQHHFLYSYKTSECLRCKRFQFIKTPVRFEHFSVQFKTQELTEASRTTLLAFLIFTCMRSRICSEEDPFATRLDRIHESLTMFLTLQNREAIEMRLETPNEEI